MDYESVAEEFFDIVSKSERFTLVSHKSPDGDTICSAIALYHLLKESGKKVELCCIDSDLPMQYHFLEGFERFKKKIDYSDSIVITLDCADMRRAGFDLSGREIINIDHHKSNKHFGTHNFAAVDVATAVVLYKLIREKFMVSRKVATAIYAGLLSDSQNFTTTLVDASTFQVALELIGVGVEPADVAKYVNRYKSLAHTRLIARTIESLELCCSGKVALMNLRREALEANGAHISDIDGLVDFGLSLATVELAVLIVEFPQSIKVSLRSKKRDVSEIAIAFGGGGHKNAAGFEVKSATIETVSQSVTEKIKEELNDA